jgi:uncharacterized protein YgiM (DUF1202 family)
MVIRFLLSLVLLLVTPWQAFAAPKFPYTAEVNSDRVNVRSGENNNFEVLAILNKGDRLIVTGKSFAWFKVRLPEGAKAFLKSEYARLITPEVGEVTADRVNVRAQPNTDATILGQLVKGSQFFVKEPRSDGWIWIKPVNEISGWVHESLIAFKSNQILPTDKTAAVGPAQKAAEARPVVKPALVSKLANGLVECSGKLIKVEGAPPSYQVFREGRVACLVEGPSDVLQRFENRSVTVQGRAGEDRGAAHDPVVVMSRIKLLLQ